MAGFHSVTHVPTLQQAQTIVREQSLFGTGKEVDVHALKIAEFVDNYCDSHITTRFPEDLSRLLIDAFKAGQANVMAYVPDSPSKAERDLQSDIRYLISKTENCESILIHNVRPAVEESRNWIFPVLSLLVALLAGISYIAIVVSR